MHTIPIRNHKDNQDCDPSTRTLTVFGCDVAECNIEAAIDSKCNFSGVLSSQKLNEIEKVFGKPFPRHKLTTPVVVQVFSGDEADGCDEYVELDIAIRFKHGPVRMNKLKFAILGKDGKHE